MHVASIHVKNFQSRDWYNVKLICRFENYTISTGQASFLQYKESLHQFSSVCIKNFEVW